MTAPPRVPAPTMTTLTPGIGHGGGLRRGEAGGGRLEIWTDVPRIFTADPRGPLGQAPPAARLPRAQEIATTGSRVLHPRCIPALRDHAVPIHIHSTPRPELEGTVIRRGATDGPAQVKAIPRNKGVVLVSMETVGMWPEVGFLAEAFDVFRRLGISIAGLDLRDQRHRVARRGVPALPVAPSPPRHSLCASRHRRARFLAGEVKTTREAN